MGLSIFKTNFYDLSSHGFLRFDVKNKFILKNINFNEYELLGNIFEIINGNSYTKYYSEEKTKIPFVRIGDLSFTDGISDEDIIYLNEECKIDKSKVLKKDDIILATIGATIGKLSLVKDFEGGTFSNNTVVLRIKDKSHNIYFLEKLLQTNIMQRSIWGSVSQKSQPNLQDYDLRNIKIPKISRTIQDQLFKKISPIETQISELKSSKKRRIDIINKVFSEEFKFNFEEFNRLKSEKIVSSSLVNFSNNIDCRFGYRFQHKSGKYMMDFLKSKTQKRIKDYVAIPITLGKSVSPSQYDEDGEYYYISMATVKKFYFDKEDAKKVSDEYSSQNLNKAVKKNDIIMTRSGMAIGKFALIKENIKGIYADFTMRIRLENYNHQLAYYYFRSVFFQQLITTNKKGLQNHNIFPSMIQEFPIPDWSIEKQNEICDSITKQIEEQKEIDRKIEQQQNEIKNLIENAIESE